MSTSVKELMAAANASVPAISPQDAKALIERGQALVVDVRDGLEIQGTGKVQGAKHVARGMLEFRADPESPYYDKAFDRDKTVIVYCASGGRSALAGGADVGAAKALVRRCGNWHQAGAFPCASRVRESQSATASMPPRLSDGCPHSAASQVSLKSSQRTSRPMLNAAVTGSRT